MIIKKQYLKIKTRGIFTCKYMITSWNLFGIIPLYITETLLQEK